MEFLFDTANINDIKKYGEYFPYTGVTSNPSIIKAGVGKVDFVAHFKEIRAVIGKHRSLHIQVLAKDCDTIIKEALTILDKIDRDVYIKIPVTEQGLAAIQVLKTQNVNITATAIYSKIQGFLAIAAGADYIAPYYNRMENQDLYSDDTIASLAKVAGSTKIVAASFKNISQVNRAIEAGAHAVTVQPALLSEGINLPSVSLAIDNFIKDWQAMYGVEGLHF